MDKFITTFASRFFHIHAINGERFFEFRANMASVLDVMEALTQTTDFNTMNSQIRIKEITEVEYLDKLRLPQLFERTSEDVKFFNEIENRVHDLEQGKEHIYHH